jgi:TM2 domain-containing membrane protein YozV
MSTTFTVPLRSTGAAYLWWFFLGWWGAHQFYLGKPWRGAAYLVFGLLAMPTLFGGPGLFLVFFLVLMAMLLWDLFTMPAQARRANAKLIHEYGGF